MKHLDYEQMEMFGGPAIEHMGGGYTASVGMPDSNAADIVLGTGQYGEATQVAETSDAGTIADASRPFLFGQVSSSAPNYDFSGLFGGEQDTAQSSIIKRLIQWAKSLLDK